MRGAAIGFTFVVALFLLVRGAGVYAKSGSAYRPLTIQVRDYASVAHVPMRAAITRVKKIFVNAGVPARIRVLDATRSDDLNDEGASDPTVRIIVYPSTRSDIMSADTKVLGIAPGAEGGGTLLKNVILAKLVFTPGEAAAIRDSLF